MNNNYRNRVVEFVLEGEYVSGTVEKQTLTDVYVRLDKAIPSGTTSLQHAWVPIPDLTRVV